MAADRTLFEATSARIVHTLPEEFAPQVFIYILESDSFK